MKSRDQIREIYYPLKLKLIDSQDTFNHLLKILTKTKDKIMIYHFHNHITTYNINHVSHGISSKLLVLNNFLFFCIVCIFFWLEIVDLIKAFFFYFLENYISNPNLSNYISHIYGLI